MNILPSKNFSLVLGTIIFSGLLITGAIYFTEKYQRSGVKTSAEEIAQASQTQKEILSRDSDNDGLPDWEETLWGADPNKADTDGDGMSDGEEVKTGHNPIVKGPNDKLNDDILLAKTNTKEATTTLDNSTTDMAIGFFQHYLELKRQKGTITAEDKDALINQALNETPVNLVYKTYSLKDLIISSDLNSPAEANQTYQTNLKAIFARAANPQNTENEVDILNRALQNTATAPAELKKIDLIIASYNQIIKGLLTLKAPNQLALYHLDLVNSYSRVYQNIKYMKEKFSDPLILLSIIKDYENSVIDMATAISNLFEQFEK